MNNSWVPQTTAEWFNWLKNAENKTRNSYLAKPENLISEYLAELATKHDYKGREILEILQNAADQARKASVAGKVLIELLQEGLIIGNTGEAFSTGGIASLETKNLSPKRHNQKQFIGNKGLGFRSILNWTNEPMIFSDSLNLVYSKKVSQTKLKELQEEKSELNDLIINERKDKNILPIPILPFPGYTRDGNVDGFLEGTAARHMQKRCKQLQEEGYTTTIGIPFEDKSYFDKAREQINSLQPEILLFVDHLDEICFFVHGEEERTWKKDKNGRQYMVMDDDEPLGIWQVHKTQGEVPEQKLQTGQKSPLHYELIVAVPEVVDFDELKTSPLFSHFPTNIRLPLPVVCHATLELDQSRKHTQECKSNTYILEKLATFLAQVAEERADLHQTGPEAGFRMLMAQETYPNDLAREGFPEKLIKAAAQRKIVPTLEGTVKIAEQAQMLSGASESWLPKSAFGNIVPVANKEEENFFRDLGVEELETEELRQILLFIKDISIEQRAELIVGLLERKISSDSHTSALLLNSDGKNIPDEAAVFNVPKSGKTPRLPEWVTLWFLNNDLRLALFERLETKENRDLYGKISSFGFLKYSLSTLINRIISSANKEIKQRPNETSKINQQLLSTIFMLYCAEGQSGNVQTFPSQTSLPLPTQEGGFASAKDLYMGRGYGTEGNITQDLYQSWAPELLLIEPGSLGLPVPENESLVGFFQWVGVAQWPRPRITTSYPQDKEYLNYALDSIHYPASLKASCGVYTLQSRTDVTGCRLTNIQSIDGLEKILEKGNSVAIAAWLALDNEVPMLTGKTRNSAQLNAQRGRDLVPRIYGEPLPSYIKWKIETTEWLLDKNRDSLRPKDCVTGQSVIEKLFPKPARPDKTILELYGVKYKDLVRGWHRSGVLTSPEELESDDIYLKLLGLPKRQPKGESARKLYVWFLNSEISQGKTENVRKQFFADGKMWGRYKGEKKYFHVTELHHADSETLPSALLDQLKIVDLPYRVGSKKVKNIFGLTSIDRADFTQEIKQVSLVENIDTEFQQAKPYFKCLRVSQSTQGQHLASLDRLTLKICSKLCAQMNYKDKQFEHELPIWGSLIDKDILYIRSDPAEHTSSSSDLLADTIGEAMASVFGIGSGGDFARIFGCQPANRKTLLKRMLGEDSNVDIDAIIRESNEAITEEPIEMLADIGPIEDLKPAEEGDQTIEQTMALTETVQDVQEESENNVIEGKPLTIEELDHKPSLSQNKHDIRIQKRASQHSGSASTYGVADGEFAERKIMEFEESSQRYPLRVGQYMGTKAPGCDILSFDNAKDWENFKSGANRSRTKIKRFIEVKGRKNPGAKIELRGNEKIAAKEYGDRYYLYRLFVSEDSKHDLHILQNPLASEAVETSIYIDIDRAPKEKVQHIILHDGIEK